MAKTVKRHKDGILAYVETGLSNGVVEGINNKIRAIIRRAYGFRNPRLSHLSLRETEAFPCSASYFSHVALKFFVHGPPHHGGRGAGALGVQLVVHEVGRLHALGGGSVGLVYRLPESGRWSGTTTSSRSSVGAVEVRWRFLGGRLYALGTGSTLLFPEGEGALRPGAFASMGLGVDNAR